MSLRPERGISDEFRADLERRRAVGVAKKKALKMKIRMMLEMGASVDDIIATLKNEYGYKNVIRAMVEMGLFSGGDEFD